MSATLTADRPAKKARRRPAPPKPVHEPHWTDRFAKPVPDSVWDQWRGILAKRGELVVMLNHLCDLAADADLDQMADAADKAILPILEAVDTLYSELA